MIKYKNNEDSTALQPYFTTLRTCRTSYPRGAAFQAAWPAEVVAFSGALRARNAGTVDSGLVWWLDRSGRRGAPRFGAVEEKTMRTFEFRVYKLRTKEALEFYIGRFIPVISRAFRYSGLRPTAYGQS